MGLLIWAPPIIAPLTFALIGVLGISAVWIENPPDSGVLTLLGGRKLRMPFSKTRAFFFWVALAMLATVISSVLDHARANFQNPWLWIPTGVGIFGTVVTAALGAIDSPKRGDLIVYLCALALMTITGDFRAAGGYSTDAHSKCDVVKLRFHPRGVGLDTVRPPRWFWAGRRRSRQG